MIGDPNQLPATIFSTIAEKKQYDRSLFHRMQTAGFRVTLLNEQYRMNDWVSKFISDSFYQAKLKDNANLDAIIGEPALYAKTCLEKLCFFHTSGDEEFENGSYQNLKEVDLVANVCEEICQKVPEQDLANVGIISPYSRQVFQLKEKLKSMRKEIATAVEVNTVDGFQGREKDVIVFSCVRSYTVEDTKRKNNSIGFLDDARRMNVSLSRARISLIVTGNIRKLYESKKWKKLIDYSYGMGVLYDLDGWVNQASLPVKLDKLKVVDLIKYLN
jgi:senataxin